MPKWLYWLLAFYTCGLFIIAFHCYRWLIVRYTLREHIPQEENTFYRKRTHSTGREHIRRRGDIYNMHRLLIYTIYKD